MKTAVLVITVPLLAKEGLGEVDYDPALQRRGNGSQGGGVKTAVLVFTVPLLAKEGDLSEGLG